MKKATIEDVAKLAGVSKATVSYVLNYSNKKKISHDTRIKVFEAAEMLNYVPNRAAQNLALNKNGGENSLEDNIGIIFSNKSSKLRPADNYLRSRFLQNLSKSLNSIKDSLHIFDFSEQLNSDLEIPDISYLNAIILSSLDNEEIERIKDQVYVPIILLNSLMQDYLFHEINFNYKAVLNNLSCDCLVIGSEISEYLRDTLQSELAKEKESSNKSQAIKIIELKNSDDLDEIFKAYKNSNIKFLFVNEIDALSARKYIDDKNISVAVYWQDNLFADNHQVQKILLPTEELIEKLIHSIHKLLMLKGNDLPHEVLIDPSFYY